MQQTTLSHDVINSLEDALDSKNNSGSKSDSPFLQAHVLRTDDDGTTWVHIIGGVRETPVNGGSITSVKNKDLVLVNVSDGKCSIIGNLTSPSSDDSVAIDAKKTAIAASKNTRDAQEQIKIASKVANSALENLFTDMQVWTTEIKGTNPSTNPNVWTLTKPTSIRAGIQMWSATKRVYNNGIIELHDIVPYTGIVSQTTYFYQTIIPDGDSAPKTPVGVEPEGWLQTPPALPVDEASEEDANSNIYSSVRTFYGDGSYRWSTPSKNGFASTWINNTYVLQSVKSQTTANTENITKQSTSITQNSEAIELNAKTIKSVQDSTQANASDLATYILNQTKTNESLQSQIDGSIETWFYEVPPTSENEPASNWTTTDLKNNHLGDLYYDTKTGYCYRYQVINNEYSWQRITDVDVTKALADAKNAQDTADNKRRIFTVTPIPPYDKGDLWVQGSTGDILVCQTQKTSEQSYDETDWVLASKYTDDSYAETKFTETSEKIEAQAKKIDENGTKIATLTETADGITQTVESHYTELTEYKTSNDTAVSEAKNIATTAKSTAETADSNASTALSTANDVDKRLKSVESDYVTSATLNTTKESIEADISSTLTESKKYTDDSITTEVTNRNAAITAKADEINSSVEKTYITKDSADAMSAIGRNIVIGTYEIFNPVLDSDSNTYNYYSVSTWGKRELNNRITSASPENPMDICISFDWSTSGWDKWESSSDFTPEFDINFEYISMNHSIGPSETNASGYYSEVTHVYPGNYSNFYVYPDSAFSAISETESIPIKLYAEGLKNVTLKIYNLKIEFGHAPTTWTLAPEDAQYIYSTKTELDQTAETISSSVSKKVSIGENGTVSDLSSVMEQSADGVLVKFSKTVGEQTFQPAIELTTDSDYDNASTVNAAIKMWESLSIRNSGGTPVTEINGPTMKINKVVVVDSIRIGTWLLASRSETTTSGSSEIIEIRSI